MSRSSFAQFWWQQTPLDTTICREKSRKVAKGRERSRLQYKKKSHSHCNCWNSLAVMFELRCSKFELGCSESAGKPPSWTRPNARYGAPTNMKTERVRPWVTSAVFRRLRVDKPNTCCSAPLKTLGDSWHWQSAAFLGLRPPILSTTYMTARDCQVPANASKTD